MAVLTTSTFRSIAAGSSYKLITTGRATFAASTTVVCSAQDLYDAIPVGSSIFNFTNDTVSSAVEVVGKYIDSGIFKIILRTAYAGTTGASKEVSITGFLTSKYKIMRFWGVDSTGVVIEAINIGLTAATANYDIYINKSPIAAFTVTAGTTVTLALEASVDIDSVPTLTDYIITSLVFVASGSGTLTITENS
mgnify:CR=1 FL=1